jgi:hypothetical protein
MMRKIVCLMLSLLLSTGLMVSAMAAEGDFVPSISAKNGPEIISAILENENVDECVIVTSLEEADDKSTDISQEDWDLLLEVYEMLKDGTSTLPLEEEYVIRDLFDLSFEYDDCRQIEEHGHKDEKLKEKGKTLTVTFDVDTDEEIFVFVYVDGKWVQVENVVNNGDGTITCVFEDICPVAFAVEEKEPFQNPTTGDMAGKRLIPLVAMMCLSLICLVMLVVPKRRRGK